MDYSLFGIYLVALHHVAFCIPLAFGVMSRTYGSGHTGTTSVQHRLLGIMTQLHTLLGMKAGVNMHPYAYIIGLA